MTSQIFIQSKRIYGDKTCSSHETGKHTGVQKEMKMKMHVGNLKEVGDIQDLFREAIIGYCQSQYREMVDG